MNAVLRTRLARWIAGSFPIDADPHRDLGAPCAHPASPVPGRLEPSAPTRGAASAAGAGTPLPERPLWFPPPAA